MGIVILGTSGVRSSTSARACRGPNPGILIVLAPDFGVLREPGPFYGKAPHYTAKLSEVSRTRGIWDS